MNPDDLVMMGWVANGGDFRKRPTWMLASLEQSDHWWWLRDTVDARIPRYDLSPLQEAIMRADAGYTLPWHPSGWDRDMYKIRRARREAQEIAAAHEFQLYRLDLVA
jgi:hypothetical protein